MSPFARCRPSSRRRHTGVMVTEKITAALWHALYQPPEDFDHRNSGLGMSSVLRAGICAWRLARRENPRFFMFSADPTCLAERTRLEEQLSLSEALWPMLVGK